jgi:hypothetical protein
MNKLLYILLVGILPFACRVSAMDERQKKEQFIIDQICSNYTAYRSVFLAKDPNKPLCQKESQERVIERITRDVLKQNKYTPSTGFVSALAKNIIPTMTSDIEHFTRLLEDGMRPELGDINRSATITQMLDQQRILITDYVQTKPLAILKSLDSLLEPAGFTSAQKKEIKDLAIHNMEEQLIEHLSKVFTLKKDAS